jgi:sugar phosphate isomerase/epimerase
MRIGCWTTLENPGRIVDAGFEYIECPVATLVPTQGEAEFRPVLKEIEASPLPLLAFNLFIPPEIKIVGPAVDVARLRAYARTALERIHATGARLLVFGSGPARTIPEGFSRARAEEQFVEFCRFVGDVAARNDVLVGIESIQRKGGNNFVTTFEESVQMARKAGSPALRAMADVGQMEPENEPWSHLSQYAEWITHVHLTDTERKAPGFGSLAWTEAFGELHKAGYDGTMSWECRWDDFGAQAATSIRFVRDMWEKSRPR